jgi:CHRD domain
VKIASWKMVGMRYAAALLMGLSVGWFGLPSLAQSGETYKTRLSALPADARTRADLAGIGSVTATLSGTKLTVNGTFEGLKTNAVAAKLQNGIVAGVRGPVFADLTITKAMSGTISGSADLNPQELQNLKKGGIYVQIYTEKPTDGTLWGWLLR